MNTIYNKIVDISKQFGASKVVLFGSRARGDCRERSDIDIAVYGVGNEKQAAFRSAVDGIPTLLSFDVVFVTNGTDKALLQNIEKDGKTIMSKFNEKYENLQSAVKRLKAAISDYDKYHLDSVRDGAIQRFEFCTELAWKTIREYLIEQGYTDVNSPRSVMKTAFSDGLLKNESGWLEILESRNITSHVYDEKTAETVFDGIKNVFIPLFDELVEKLNVKNNII